MGPRLDLNTRFRQLDARQLLQHRHDCGITIESCGAMIGVLIQWVQIPPGHWLLRPESPEEICGGNEPDWSTSGEGSEPQAETDYLSIQSFIASRETTLSSV